MALESSGELLEAPETVGQSNWRPVIHQKSSSTLNAWKRAPEWIWSMIQWWTTCDSVNPLLSCSATWEQYSGLLRLASMEYLWWSQVEAIEWVEFGCAIHLRAWQVCVAWESGLAQGLDSWNLVSLSNRKLTVILYCFTGECEALLCTNEELLIIWPTSSLGLLVSRPSWIIAWGSMSFIRGSLLSFQLSLE